MNGRVYDPLIGRFGAPDPMTESPYSTQGWNRYAYVGNSPLNFADPSGYCFLGCFWQKPFKALGKLLRRAPILGNILTVAAGVICGPVCSTLASAAVAGLASGDIGAALKAGLISAVTAGAFQIAGDLTGNLGLSGILDPQLGGHGPLEFLSEAHIFNVAAHAAVGCGSAVLSGGECGAGALSGAVGSFSSHMPFAQNLGKAGKLIFVSTSGGLASVAGGGKFGNGAITAAFGYLFNEQGSNIERGYETENDPPSLGQCLKKCAIEHYGLDDLLGDGLDDVGGRAAVAAGSVPLSKRAIGVRVYPGASEYTNTTSVLGYRLYKTNPALDPRMSFRFLGTARLFGMVGRALPFVGAGIAAYDAASIGYCTYQCQSRRP